ncbi:hypothetical protein [Chamaesiphon sp. OTE_20_metabat_361]|uniref:hypothetical protein n=1 Tax=Chamaesiphon sp. OTE_20_metabat_361 TaxID=2964689 RepID=UPI00286CAA2B|nr:hypothetical protein [Chamaesiphon sp. OTE_20_metabat_361]
MMSRYRSRQLIFMGLWTAISPTCLAIVGGTFWFTQLIWYPTSDLRISIAVYLSYWLLLGMLQGALLFKFQHQKLAYRWFLTTSITGFLIMFLHDLHTLVFDIDTGGQGALYLMLSLPCLAILGGPILGFAQFELLRRVYPATSFRWYWFALSLISWNLNVGAFFLAIYTQLPFVIPFLAAAAGTALKGYGVMKRLQI